MTAAVLAVLPVALGALAASVPVVAMAAVVAGSATRRVLASFTLGWLAGLFVASMLGLVVFDLLAADAERDPWVYGLRALLGAALVALAVRKLAARGSGGGEPGWMRAMSTLSTARALSLAFALGSVNPKNLVIAVSGAAVVVEATPHIPTQIAAMGVFVVVASVGVAMPLVAVTVGGERASAPLGRFVDWFARHSTVVLGSVLALIGLAIMLPALAALLR